MTHPDFPTDRPMPDPADLRLLAELINNVSIPLANAAWNAQMSQAEAALRLVSMAERGMPLRLVADGDRTALWHIAQAGPVAPPPVPSGPVSPAPSGPYAPAPVSPAPSGPYAPATPAPTAPPAASTPSGPYAPAPPESVPLGDPPFGDGNASEQRTPTVDTPPAPSGATSSAADSPWQRHTVDGPDGEQLAVTILHVTDPADAALSGEITVGAGQRSVLVHSRVENTGSVGYAAPGDLYLVLETDRQTLLGRTAAAVTSHPGFVPGVAAGQTVDGWSLFLIPQDTTVAGIKWCIRPDIPQSILSWPIAP